MPIISPLGRLSREECRFEARLGNSLNFKVSQTWRGREIVFLRKLWGGFSVPRRNPSLQLLILLWFSAPRSPSRSHVLSPLLLLVQTALALSRLFLFLSALDFSRYSRIFSFSYPKWKPPTNRRVTLAVSIMNPLPKPRRSTNGPLSKGLGLS